MKTHITSVLLLISLLAFNTEGRATRLWGDEGKIAGLAVGCVFPASCLMADDVLLTVFGSYDDSGNYRAAYQGVGADGSLYFEDGPRFLGPDVYWLDNFDVAAFSDGQGGAWVFWHNISPSDQSWVLGQHLDSELNPLWEEGGKQLYQNNWGAAPLAMSSPEGGFIIAQPPFDPDLGEEQDPRPFVIRRFSPEGNLVEGWDEDGISLPNAHIPIVDSNLGFWLVNIVGRNDNRTTTEVIFIDANGEFRFDQPLQIESPANYLHYYGQGGFAPDHRGGFYLDYKSIGFDDRLHALQHFDADGDSLTSVEGIEAMQEANFPNYAYILTDSSGGKVYLIAEYTVWDDLHKSAISCWQATENGIHNVWEHPIRGIDGWISTSKAIGDLGVALLIDDRALNTINSEQQINFISSSGELSWPENPPRELTKHQIIPQSNGHFYTLSGKNDSRYIDGSLVITSFDVRGRMDWAGHGSEVIDWNGMREGVRVKLMGNNDVRLVGEGYYQLLDEGGNRRNPNALSLPVNEYVESAVASGESIAIFSGEWVDTARVQVLGRDNVLRPESPLIIPDMMRMFEDGVGGYFASFLGGEEVNWDIGVRRIDSLGRFVSQPMFPRLGRVDTDLLMSPINNGDVWIVGPNTGRNEYFVQRIDANNHFAWNEDRQLSWDNTIGGEAQLLTMPDSSLMLIANERRGNAVATGAFFMRYDWNGQAFWGEPKRVFSADAGVPTIIYDGLRTAVRHDGGVWMVASCRIESNHIALFLQLIDSNGERVLGDEGFRLADADGGNVQILVDQNDGVWVFMTKWSEDSRPLCAYHYDDMGELIGDGRGTLVTLDHPEEVHMTQLKEPWLYEDGSVGLAFTYSNLNCTITRVQRIRDDIDEVAGDKTEYPIEFEIGSIFPQPTNGEIVVNYSLVHAAEIRLVLVDGMGRTVGEFFNGHQSYGEHQASLKLHDTPSGEYFVRLSVGEENVTKKVVVLK